MHLSGVASHKYVIAFCFGLELLNKSTRTLTYVIYIVTFSVITAIGGGIGIGVSEAVKGSGGYSVTVAVLLGKHPLMLTV